MKKHIPFALLTALCAASASAQDGLYSVGIEPEDSLPLKWVVGGSIIYDDNVNAGRANAKEDSFALNPYVGTSFVSIDPQTTWDVFARLGLIYYFDAPGNADEFNSQSRIGVNLTHRFNERLRYVSRNFISYELEPDYAYGYASSRNAGEYFYWSTDQSLGYRWSERVATYTGFSITGTNYIDVNGNDRLNGTLYQQFRYQWSPQTVFTADYRYGRTLGDGDSSNSSDHTILGGVEHRFNPNTVGVLKLGAQFREVDDGSSNTSPNLEFALRTRVNQQFSIRSFAKYGMEYQDTVQYIDIDNNLILDPIEYDDRQTLRLGVTGEYILSPKFSMFAGVDYINTANSAGRSISNPPLLGAIADADEDLINAHLGLSMRVTDTITGTLSYTHTNSVSDIAYREYDRNRISVGLAAEF
jgi:hypothetical protein